MNVFSISNMKSPFDFIHNYKYRNKIKYFKDIYRGTRGFIIGNGPSLTPDDLELLKQEVTFASNKIYLSFDRTDWRPSVYCSEDDLVLEQHYQNIMESINCPIFFPTKSLKIIPRQKGAIYYNFNWPGWGHKKMTPTPYSWNIANVLYGGATVTYSLMQICTYMGIREIYLIGCDHNFDLSAEEFVTSHKIELGQDITYAELRHLLLSTGHFTVNTITHPGDVIFGNDAVNVYSRDGLRYWRARLIEGRIVELEASATPEDGTLAPINKVEVNGLEIRSTGAQNHFDERYRLAGERWFTPNIKRIERAYTLARDEIEERGGSIYNATRGGALEVFPRVDFDSLFEAVPAAAEIQLPP